MANVYNEKYIAVVKETADSSEDLVRNADGTMKYATTGQGILDDATQQVDDWSNNIEVYQKITFSASATINVV